MNEHEKRLRDATNELILAQVACDTELQDIKWDEWDKALTAFYRKSWQHGYRDGLSAAQEIVRKSRG